VAALILTAIFTVAPYPAAYRAVTPKSGRRASAKPKYRSKAHPHTTWSGRGMTPIWMRQEMKGTRLEKNDFLIK
jgi:DNA-binding protein H-NS